MTTGSERAPAAPESGKAPPRTRFGAVILERLATRADLDNLPRTWRGEIIHGTLYAFPRPRVSHQQAGGTLYQDLGSAFGRGRGGPGGWWILIEPGIHLPGEDEFSPEIAGWRRASMPRLPQKMSTVPDWICEVLSPGTRAYDVTTKRRLYAEIGVSYLWYLDPSYRILTASKLEGGRWVELGAWKDDEKVRAEPFEAIELDLTPLWEGFEDEKDTEEASPAPPSATV